MSTLSGQYITIVVYTTTSEEQALALMLGLDLTKNQSPISFQYEEQKAFLKIEEVHLEKSDDKFPEVGRFSVIVKGKVL